MMGIITNSLADSAIPMSGNAAGPSDGYETETRPPWKVLLVVAHPDDESECSAVVYRCTHELGGTVDQVVVTNGEGGHRYSAPAEAYYKLPLSGGSESRELLTHIRREEGLRASRILGIRQTWFLDQKDAGPTADASEGLRLWDVDRIRRELLSLLHFEKYEVVLVLLPTTETHGHHQTVAALTLEAISEIPPDLRPAVAGVQTQGVRFSELDGYPLTRTSGASADFTFDRRTPLECHPKMDYTVVAHWVIAEHKSQGIFQMEYGRRSQEFFWLFQVAGDAGAARWREFSRIIGRKTHVAARL